MLPSRGGLGRRERSDSLQHMLLVILGAGASYDSLPLDIIDEIPRTELGAFRPPLAQNLFDDRPTFGAALDMYPQCTALVSRLRQSVRGGAALEHELERYQEEAQDYPPHLRQLIAIRFYLQEILWTCGTRYRELSHGVTNYVRLLYRLDRWRHANNEA